MKTTKDKGGTMQSQIISKLHPIENDVEIKIININTCEKIVEKLFCTWEQSNLFYHKKAYKLYAEIKKSIIKNVVIRKIDNKDDFCVASIEFTNFSNIMNDNDFVFNKIISLSRDESPLFQGFSDYLSEDMLQHIYIKQQYIQKRKLFIDVDNVIIKSTKRVIDLYNNEISKYNASHNSKKKLSEIKFSDINDWEMSAMVDLTTLGYSSSSDLFDNDIFYDFASEEIRRYFYKDAVNSIKSLSQKFDLYIITKGNKKNLRNKFKCLQKVIGSDIIREDNYIGLPLHMNDKSSINMKNSIFIDDLPDNLLSSNARYKIMFVDKNVPWQNKWVSDESHNKYTINNWSKLYKKIIRLERTIW